MKSQPGTTNGFFMERSILQKDILSSLLAIIFILIPLSLIHASQHPYISSHGIAFSTGNKHLSEIDYTLASPVQQFRFKRYYNSQSKKSGPLGYGWSLGIAHHSTLGIYSDKIVLFEGNGRIVKFFPQGTDTWVNETGKKRTITLSGTDYELINSDGTTRLYNSSGKIIEERDEQNNSISYGYTGELLTTVSNAFGQQFTISYTDNLVDTLSTPNGDFIYSYDTNNNLKTVTKPDTTTVQYIYDDPNDAHNLTGIIDENNTRIATIAYDTYDRVQSSEKADGSEKVTIEYLPDLQRKITRFKTTEAGTEPIETTYQLEVRNGIVRVSSFTGPGCSSCGDDTGSSYIYNDRLQVDQKTDAKGNITKYEYDDNGNLWKKTEAFGTVDERVTTWNYDPITNKLDEVIRPSIANPGQNSTTTLNYYPDGKLLQSRVEAGYSGTTPITRTSSYTYDPYGRIETIDGPRTDVSDITVYDYYPNTPEEGLNRGQLKSVTNPLGHAVTFSSYNTCGKPETVTTPSSTIALGYDLMCRVKTRTQGTITLTNQYYPNGQLQQVDVSNSRSVTYKYYGNGKLERIEDNMGNYIFYSYNSTNGKQKRQEIHDQTGTLQYFVDYTYEDTGRLDTITFFDGIFENLDYDPVGNLEKRTDAEQHITTYLYDALNRLESESVTTATGNAITGYDYDPQDNLTLVNDAEQKSTTYKYDDFGRRTSRTSPDTGLTTYIYDNADNLISSTASDNQVTTYEYDVINRVKAVHYPDSAQDVIFRYDEENVLDQGVNAIGHLTTMIDATGTTNYAYNPTGNVISVVRTMGGTVQTTGYGYNAATGELDSMTYPSGLVVGYQRNANGSIQGLTANGQTLAQDATYMPFGPLKGYTYGNNQQTVAKGYNKRYILTGIQGGGLNYQYTHYPTGQVKSISGVVQPGTTDTSDAYNYEPGSNRLDNQTGTTPRDYTLDANGNTTSDGTRTFHYDVFNRLIRVEEGSTTIAEYAYNNYNQRVSKTINGTVTLYLYDLGGNLIAETAQDGTPLREYIYFNGQPFALMIHESTQAGLYFFINDHLGTPQRLVTSSGQPVWQAAYLPFGKAQVIINTITNNLRFPGQYYDAETGLHFNWNRYYDPDLGRYISADPIGLQGGVNLFAYVQNNPVNWVDPEGLISRTAVKIIVVNATLGVTGIAVGVPLTLLQMATMADETAYDGGVIGCTYLMSSEDGEGKNCFYTCSDTSRSITINKCDECPSNIFFPITGNIGGIDITGEAIY